TVRELRPAHNRMAGQGRWLLFYSFATPSQTVDAAVGVPPSVAAQFHVGQQIDVVYVPNDPEVTALDPDQAWAVFVYDEWVLVPCGAGVAARGGKGGGRGRGERR